MIEKLDILNSVTNVFTADNHLADVAVGVDTINKINEIIDTVNELQKDYENVCVWISDIQKLKTPTVNVQDKFAEQRKWIGKLCKFWDDYDECYVYEILVDIDGSGDLDYPYKTNDASFKHCEPVSEDLIYKKENEFTYQEIIIGDMHENKGEK